MIVDLAHLLPAERKAVLAAARRASAGDDFAAAAATYLRRLERFPFGKGPSGQPGKRNPARGKPLLVPEGHVFHRHAERFGPELVNETAAQLGIEVSARRSRSAARRQRRTDEQLVAEVLQLHERGLRAWPIADTLNVSERRVKEILAQADAA